MRLTIKMAGTENKHKRFFNVDKTHHDEKFLYIKFKGYINPTHLIELKDIANVVVEK